MALLEDVKASMRITNNALNSTLQDDIEAGTLDLVRVGVQPYLTIDGVIQVDKSGNPVLKDDALINQSLKLYCKWQEDYESKGEQYEKSYEGLRDSMSLCGDYNA